MRVLVTTRNCPSDVIFVVDASRRVAASDYARVRTFLSQLVGRLGRRIDSGNMRVGLLTYATTIGTRYNLNSYTSVASVIAAISALSYTGGQTNTAAALAYVRRSMLTSAAGDRRHATNVIVVFTDGRSTDSTTTQVCVTGVALPKDNEASAEVTTAYGGTFTSCSARLSSQSRYRSLNQ